MGDINGDECFVYEIHEDPERPLAGWVANEEGITANEVCSCSDDALMLSESPNISSAPSAGWVANEEGITANEVCYYSYDALMSSESPTISSVPSELPSISFAPTKFILPMGSPSISVLPTHSLIPSISPTECVDREGWENISSFYKSIDTLGCL